MLRRARGSVLLAMLAGVALLVAGAPGAADQDGEARALYLQHCASCHGEDRLGGTGPALLPESLARLRMPEALRAITAGRPATQMPAFEGTLSPEAIAAVAAWIYEPLPEPPTWTTEQMQASRTVLTPPDALPEKPVHAADPLNLFTVVETGDSQVTILDGDAFEPVWRFPSRFALHGGAKYSPDGRFVYLGSRDGWVSKHDLHGLKSVAEIRAGINLRNIAVSADGRYVIVGNTLPNTVVILDAGDLTPLKVIPVEDRLGRASRVSAVYTAPPRQSFIVALRDQPELWEIAYEDDPEPQATGFVHSYQPGMLEGAFDHGPFPVRRIPLDEPLDDFFFDTAYRVAVGAGRASRAGQVINLNVGRKVADVSIGGMPHLASGISFEYQGRPVLATPVLNEPAVVVIDMTTWQPIKRIATGGAGFFMRSHENTPYAWIDTSLGPKRDQIQIIDKRSLEIVRTLVPEPGRLTSHVEFSRDGRHALVSVAEMDGALLVYDAASFEVVKRIPMRKPSGKYNVYNKINLSSGTSH
ncbi:MAG TPA: cytochrome D1 domain-containing protein [Rhodospirillales bacterium]|nr:cytochrome D1 domain-containing protein [Rhodospirillales bacterium]